MKNKLIPKHLKAGKLLINEPVSESTYREQSPLSLQEQLFIRLSNALGRPPTEAEMIQDESSRQANLYSDAINTGIITEAKEDNAKNNFFRGYNNFRYSHPWAKGLNWTPIIGDVMDGISLAGDLNNKNYASAGIGLAALALPNFILKPLQKTKDFIKLGKYFNEIGTGLKNPYVRKKFYKWMGDPSFSLLFLNKYGKNASGMSLEKAKEVQKDLKIIEDKYGVYPEGFTDYDVDDVIDNLQKGLLRTDDLIIEYNNKMNYLKNNPVLYNIAKESPQYLDLIYDDFTSGKIVNIDNYVKDLITQANTFYRRMHTNNSDDFLHIRGVNANYGRSKKAMDVGNSEVVNDPIWSTGYGPYWRKYSPKQLNLQGDVSTWWGLRFPSFKNKNITVDPEGMHSISYYPLLKIVNELNPISGLPITRPLRKYAKNNNLPDKYKSLFAHMTFLSDEDAYIGDYFNVTDNFNLMNDKLTLGYKQGGLLISKHKSGSPIKNQEPVRDNTKVVQKPLNWALQQMVDNPQDYNSYEKLISYKGRAKHEDPKKITPRKHTRPAPAWPVGGGRNKA